MCDSLIAPTVTDRSCFSGYQPEAPIVWNLSWYVEDHVAQLMMLTAPAHSLQEQQASIGTSRIPFSVLSCDLALTKSYRIQNKQCDIALNTALNSKALTSPPSELSADGKTLVADLRNVIDAAKKMLLVKNEGELIQDFVWQAQKITAGDAKRPEIPINKETSQQDAHKAVDGLKTLGTLMITNGEFRKLRTYRVFRIMDDGLTKCSE